MHWEKLQYFALQPLPQQLAWWKCYQQDWNILGLTLCRISQDAQPAIPGWGVVVGDVEAGVKGLCNHVVSLDEIR